MDDVTVFHFEDDRPSFEDFGEANGSKYWQESVVMESLGYSSREGFRKVINRAIQACVSLNIPVHENFVSQPGGELRLTRFACYLAAMNGDSRKPQVALAQAYFAKIAEAFQDTLQDADAVERVVIRDEVTQGNKSLQSTAKRHGVKRYDWFMNAGYRGMYNMNLQAVMRRKGLAKGKQFLDHIGREELAANLFRLTQTDAMIRTRNVRGQRQLEEAAEGVGKHVRRTMREISGSLPEDLPPAPPISEVKRNLKQANRGFRKLDAPPKD